MTADPVVYHTLYTETRSQPMDASTLILARCGPMCTLVHVQVMVSANIPGIHTGVFHQQYQE